MTHQPRISIEPRLLRAELAAVYCGVSKGVFLRDVDKGLMPKPVITEPGRVQWDRKQIDKALDTLADGRPYLEGWGDVG